MNTNNEKRGILSVKSIAIMLLPLAFVALPALAEWASAESPEFTVNTLPEPILCGIVSVMIFCYFRRNKG